MVQVEETQKSYERIIDAATRLFAERGYHGVSMRELAAAVDLNIATISYHVGSKPQLYHEVHARAFHKEESVIAELLKNVGDDVLANKVRFRDLLMSLVEGLIQLALEHPEIPHLHVRRWLERDEAIIQDYHDNFSLPIYRMIAGLLEQAHNAGTIDISKVNVPLYLQSFSWIHHGYFVSEPIRWHHDEANEPSSEEALKQLKAYLCEYMCRTLSLPPCLG